MMKKYVVLACAVMIASTSAFASKARLIALGEDADGSFYINDVRNVFLNPAAINDHKDTVTMEWGSSSEAVDGDRAANTEAGIFHDTGKLIYGAYLGSEATKFSTLRSSLTNYTTTGTNARKLQPTNTLDLFVGGEAGIKWGASLTYSSTEDENATTQSNQDLTVLKLGVAKNNWGGFFHYVAANEAEDKTGAGAKFEMDSDITVGGHFDQGAYRYYAQYRMNEVKNGAERTNYELGATRTKNLNDKVKLYTKGNIVMDEVKNGNENMHVKLTMGLEADVKEWLTLRASIGQRLYDVTETPAGLKKTEANTTNVNTGATFKFGDLSIDGLIGTGNDGQGNLAHANPIAANTNNEAGVLSLDSIMTRVSLTYKY